jgi:hypothetical protein
MGVWEYGGMGVWGYGSMGGWEYGNEEQICSFVQEKIKIFNYKNYE